MAFLLSASSAACDISPFVLFLSALSFVLLAFLSPLI
jgi:hypothetical protein